MALDRSTPYGVLVDSDGTPESGTAWTNAFWQGFQDRIDARWSITTNSNVGTQHNVTLIESLGSAREADYFKWSGAANSTITGFVAPASPAKPGKPLFIRNASAGAILYLAHQTGSNGGNQLWNIARSALTPLAAGGTAVYIYDSLANLWVLHAHEQGGWITPAFNAANFVAASPMSWTVEAADAPTMAYYLRGTQLEVTFYLTLTSIGGTPATELRIYNGAWGGFTVAASGLSVGSYLRVIDNGIYRHGNALVGVFGTTWISLLNPTGASGNWSASTNNTTIVGTLEFGVQ